MGKHPRSDDGEEVEEEEEEEEDEEQLLEGEIPTGIDPYAVLALDDRSASQDDIKRAYRKAALKHHPDKAAPEDKDIAHTKFQEVAFAFAILSDERRRKRYDTTGSTEESLDDDDFNWADFFREQYQNVVTGERINDFANEYKGSDEERDAVLKAYQKHKGNMSKIYQEVMLSDMVEDENRFREMIDAAIEESELKAWPDYIQESESARRKRIAIARRQRDDEAGEAEELKNELEKKKNKKSGSKAAAGGDMSSLAAIIQSRQQARSQGFIDRLEEKWAPKGRNGGRDEPSEDAFARNAKKRARK